VTTNTDQPTLTVQVVIYGNPADALGRLVASMARSAEIAVAEGVLSRVALALGDCSPTPTYGEAAIAALSTRFVHAGLSDLSYFFFDANLGHGGGHNRLLETSDSDLVVFCNPDCVASPRLLAELVRPLADPRTGLVEARQLPLEHPKPYGGSTGATPYASMACLLMRRAVVDQVGGVDCDSFFLQGDDVDFSWRARLAGWDIRHEPAAVVFHDKRISPQGHYQVNEVEDSYMLEAALILAHKYSRPDVVASLLLTYDGGRPAQRRAAETFRSREAAGSLPQPIDPDHRVGLFVDGVFSQHRY